MVITVPATGHMQNGARRINPATDMPQLLTLLEQVFGEKLGEAGKRMLSTNASMLQSPAFLWRLNPMVSKLATGYVWLENGRIVGNATLLNTKKPGRFLVVNVAVHPDYRRRGIARQLMLHLQEMAQQYGGNQMLLQVVKENSPAVDLYRSLGYVPLGSMTTWVSSVSRVREVASSLGSDATVPAIRELRSSEWRSAYRLDVAALHPDLNWPEPLAADAYKSGWWQRFSQFMNGRASETWVAVAPNGHLAGMASIWSEWGRSHQGSLRVHPAWQGQLERPLLAKIMRRLKYLPQRNIQIHHPDTDELTSAILREANFTTRRTLAHMRLDLS